jgi:hypothetical protein
MYVVQYDFFGQPFTASLIVWWNSTNLYSNSYFPATVIQLQRL